MRIFAKLYLINLYGETDFSSLRTNLFLQKLDCRRYIYAVKNLKIRNGVIDLTYLNDIVKDKRNFHIEINILNAVFKTANIRISNAPVIDTRIPIYSHHCDEIHNWIFKSSKYYYDHIVEQVLVRPSSEQYWDVVSGQRITEHFLYKSYSCKVKQIKDKRLDATSFKILNNILPCNTNLHKWGKSDTKLCCFCQEDETVSHLLFECVYAGKVWKFVNDVLQVGDVISHDDVIFGVDLNSSMNSVVSIVVYYIYKE